MTSQINPNNIDGTYPVAGQDNDSQGFRDNFTNIRNNFTFTKAELEDLQNKVVLKSALLNTTLSNDFLGNAIVNPKLTSWRETYFNAGLQTGAYTVSFSNGNFQKITMSGSLILSFSFPSNTQDSYASVKLWISNPNAAYVLSFPNSMTLGTPGTVSGFSGNSITFSSAEISTTTDYFFEVFTFDGGTTFGIRDLTRNRDFSGNSIVFTGAFVANGSALLGSGSSNVVVAATSLSTSSTTGALVVTGGVGIAGNIFATGNAVLGSSTTSNVVVAATTTSTSTNNGALVVKGGAGVAGNLIVGGNVVAGPAVNTGYFYANVETDQNLFANVLYHTFVANASPHGTVANLRFTLPDGAEDGREITFRTLVPITTCFVSNGAETSTTANTVYWIANSFATSGNVTAKFAYNASITRWVRVD